MSTLISRIFVLDDELDGIVGGEVSVTPANPNESAMADARANINAAFNRNNGTSIATGGDGGGGGGDTGGGTSVATSPG